VRDPSGQQVVCDRSRRRRGLAFRRVEVGTLHAFRVRSTLGAFEGAKGAPLFRRAYVRGLEVIVSKRIDTPYRSGPFPRLAQD